MHIGVAGNIGSGKTTLTRMLAEHYGWTPRFESVTYNPYLEDYYKNIPRWSYNLETYFLAQRFKDLIEISKSDKVIIQDRTLYEGVYIFVANNYAMGNLSKRDYETYMDLFNVMASLVHEPDLLIYLKCSIPHLVGQIQKRGGGRVFWEEARTCRTSAQACAGAREEIAVMGQELGCASIDIKLCLPLLF